MLPLCIIPPEAGREHQSHAVFFKKISTPPYEKFNRHVSLLTLRQKGETNGEA